jgi:hypothetical protein
MGLLPRITVSENRRFLVTEEGQPFFWLADTVWEIFHRLTLEEVKYYLENRRRKGFNVIQAVALAEFDGLHTPNAYGEFALVDDDPTQPNEAYFQHVDAVIRLAAEHGIYVALLPTWGDKVTHLWGVGPIVFNEENARTYGRWLGERYRDDSNVIWVLGGDRPGYTDTHDYRPIWRAMAKGIDEGMGLRAIKTYHPSGGNSSSKWLHEEEWLDFNMMQSGHGSGRSTPVWEMIASDYALTPTRPVIDAEPNYEDHPVDPWPTWNPANGYFRAEDVRRQSYRSIFAGGCGVTYGHHTMWQFSGERYEAINHADRPWKDAIDRPGAGQMLHLRRLMESRPFLSRIPDQAVITFDGGERGEYRTATRDSEGRYAMVYLPTPHPVTVRLGWAAGDAVQASWFNPRSGNSQPIGVFSTQNEVTFEPPVDGPDAVLVLDSLNRDSSD